MKDVLGLKTISCTDWQLIYYKGLTHVQTVNKKIYKGIKWLIDMFKHTSVEYKVTDKTACISNKIKNINQKQRVHVNNWSYKAIKV